MLYFKARASLDLKCRSEADDESVVRRLARKTSQANITVMAARWSAAFHLAQASESSVDSVVWPPLADDLIGGCISNSGAN